MALLNSTLTMYYSGPLLYFFFDISYTNMCVCSFNAHSHDCYLIIKRSFDFPLYTKKETSRVLFYDKQLLLSVHALGPRLLLQDSA